MNFSLKILENNGELIKNILQTLLPDISNYMDSVVKTIQNELPIIIQNAIISSPEYDSILGGQLKYEFGLIDSSSKLDALLNLWTSNLNIQYSSPRIAGNQIKSQLSVSMIKTDFSDVLGSDYANMVDKDRGYSLPWLQWLLLDGNQILVPQSSVIFGPNPRSRTGFAIMANGGGWRVPSELSGTANDNWITRAIEASYETINNFLEKALNQ